MSTSLFNIQSHIISASYTRGVDRGSRNPGDHFRLAVKAFMPKDVSRDPLAFTIILAHGIGSGKEAFEPLIDDILESNVPVRSIWTIDAAHQGESYALNAEVIGDEIDWLDYPRDIFHMINTFQHDMPPPLIGIGHSLGCGAIAQLASWHPRLFAGVAFLEPAIGPTKELPYVGPPKHYPGTLAMKRRTEWKSREEAARSLKKNPFYASFDQRVFDKVVQYELKDATETATTEKASSVTLATPKEIEVYLWMVPNPPLRGFRARHDASLPSEDITVFPGIQRPEGYHFHQALRKLYPPTLYVWGRKSFVSHSKFRQVMVEMTGSAPGGNGGVKDTEVQQMEVEAGHMMPHERPTETSAAIAKWLNELRSRVKSERHERAQGAPFVSGVQPELVERLEELSKL